MSELPLGYEVPIHTSLTANPTVGGIPRKVYYFSATLAIALLLYGQGWSGKFMGLGVAYVIHLILSRLFRRDAHYFDVIKRAIRVNNFYRA